jgi:hypothetical protein
MLLTSWASGITKLELTANLEETMNKLYVLVLALMTAAAFADDDRISSVSLTVIDRLETIELINVTEERAPVEGIAPLEEELESILAAAEELETEPEE